MISFLLQFQAVSAAALDAELKNLSLMENLLSSQEQILVEDILEILNPMKITTTFVRRKSSPFQAKHFQHLQNVDWG